MVKRYPKVIFSISFLSALLVLFFIVIPKNRISSVSPLPKMNTPVPTAFIFTTYTSPIISRKDVYKIVMIGDSMTAALGPLGGEMSGYMDTLYRKDKNSPQRIVVDNYAISSSILAVNDQLTKETKINEYTFEPLLSREFDLILVESFGYNPLSQFGVEKGIGRQTEALDTLMKTLIRTHPNSAIVFVATIAPNRTNYAKKTQPDSTLEGRTQQADERIAYLKNHIAYAESHRIPLINIFEKSLTEQGDGNVKYINPNDDIHPSFEGVEFIGQEIAHFLLDTNILPK